MLRIIFNILGLLVLLRAAHAGPDPVITAAVSHGIHELFRRYTFDDCHTEMESLDSFGSCLATVSFSLLGKKGCTTITDKSSEIECSCSWYSTWFDCYTSECTSNDMMYTSLSISSASCVSELAMLTTAPSTRASSSGKPTTGLSPSPRPTAPTTPIATSKTNGTTPVATVAISIPSSTNVLPTTATSFTPSVFPSQMNNTASTTVFGSRTEDWVFWIYLGGVWALSCMIFFI